MIWGSERTSKSPFLQNDRVHYNGKQSEDDQHFSGDGFTKSNSVVGELEDTPPPYEKELTKMRDVKHRESNIQFVKTSKTQCPVVIP